MEHAKTHLDATNIDRDLRMKGIARFPNVVKECYYVDTPYDVRLTRNASRKRKVEAEIMSKMYRFFEFPIYGEGWDQIHIVHHEKPYFISKNSFVSLLNQNPNYNDLFDSLSVVDYDPIQSRKPPSHSPFVHTYKVFEYISQNYKEDDKLAMQIAALFHDIAKPFTKVIKKGRDYASYFLYENVSTHMAVHFLKELGFEDDFVMKTANIIQMHMKIVYGDNGASEIYHLLDDEYLWKLYFFAEGDALAKN
ncbi:HD domain-containing protein [Sporosarcina sp. FSL K6-1522]|uniref:HD domain-containing protein n=1 Tax=Sporosarcina sp. FSL K6-1522 TaxID=2921554 RepID=UPI00315AE167